MITLDLAFKILVYTIGAVIYSGYYLYPRLNKRGHVTILRATSFIYAVSLILLAGVILLQSSQLLDSILCRELINRWKIFWFIINWLTVFLFLFIFLKYWLSYMNLNESAIMTGWYLNKHSTLLKNENYDAAYECLQKASRLSPDSVFFLCIMAAFNERFFEKSDECNQYLAKAKQILDSSESPSPKDQAVFEHYSGHVLECRDQLQDAIEHFKKAYELDPSPYRKKVYEDARKIERK